MSNLGGYKTAVKVIKALGGPRKAAIVLGSVAATGGYVVLRGAEAGGKKIVKGLMSVLEQRNAPSPTMDQLYTVIADSEDATGPKLRPGDQYRVLDCDADAILIEVLNDPNNPYFVSGEFLRIISDFLPEDAAEA